MTGTSGHFSVKTLRGIRGGRVRAGVMGPSKVATRRANITSATNFRPTAVRAGVVAPQQNCSAFPPQWAPE